MEQAGWGASRMMVMERAGCDGDGAGRMGSGQDVMVMERAG